MTVNEERNWGVWCHLASFSGYLGVPFGHVLGPLLVWLIKKDQSAFVDAIGKETLNYNISILIWATVSAALVLVFFIGLIPLAILGVMDFVVRILGAVAASRGEVYRYPLTIPFIS